MDGYRELNDLVEQAPARVADAAAEYAQALGCDPPGPSLSAVGGGEGASEASLSLVLKRRPCVWSGETLIYIYFCLRCRTRSCFKRFGICCPTRAGELSVLRVLFVFVCFCLFLVVFFAKELLKKRGNL